MFDDNDHVADKEHDNESWSRWNKRQQSQTRNEKKTKKRK